MSKRAAPKTPLAQKAAWGLFLAAMVISLDLDELQNASFLRVYVGFVITESILKYTSNIDAYFN